MTLSRRTVLFGIYTVCLMVGAFGVLRALVDLATHNDTASHIILVPFVTLTLLYQRRDSIFASVRWAPVAGVGVILVGLGLLLAGRLYRDVDSHEGSLSFMVGGIVVLWVGGFLLFHGREAFRAALFPLLFLGFMIPMPGIVLDRATLFLKTGSTEAVAGLFTLTRTPYYRDGFVFSLPKFAIEIADECSGIRSSIALLLTSLLAGDMFLGTGWKKALLVLAVFPVVIVKNGVRIVCLSLLATYVNPGFLTGQLHHDGGFVFFLLGLAILAPLFVLLCRSETALSKENR